MDCARADDAILAPPLAATEVVMSKLADQYQQGGQLDPQSLAVQNVGVMIESSLLMAGKLS